MWGRLPEENAAKYAELQAEMNVFYHEVKLDEKKLRPTSVEEGHVRDLIMSKTITRNRMRDFPQHYIGFPNQSPPGVEAHWPDDLPHSANQLKPGAVRVPQTEGEGCHGQAHGSPLVYYMVLNVGSGNPQWSLREFQGVPS